MKVEIPVNCVWNQQLLIYKWISYHWSELLTTCFIREKKITTDLLGCLLIRAALTPTARQTYLKLLRLYDRLTEDLSTEVHDISQGRDWWSKPTYNTLWLLPFVYIIMARKKSHHNFCCGKWVHAAIIATLPHCAYIISAGSWALGLKIIENLRNGFFNLATS